MTEVHYQIHQHLMMQASKLILKLQGRHQEFPSTDGTNVPCAFLYTNHAETVETVSYLSLRPPSIT